MSGFDILLQAANHRYDDTDNNNIIELQAFSNNTSQAASIYTNYVSSSSSSSNSLPPKKRIRLTNNHSTSCSIDGISTTISNATNSYTNNTTNSISSSTTLKKTKSWNNSTYIQFRTTNNLNNTNWDNDNMSVSTIGMRSVSSNDASPSNVGKGEGSSSSSRLLLPRTSSSLYYTNNSSHSLKKNEVWNTFSDSPTLISNDNTINNNKMMRREGSIREGVRDERGLHQLYNMSLVIPTTKKQNMKQSTRRSYKWGFNKEVNVGKGGSSCTDVNGIEMGMGYFSSSLSTTSHSSTTLSLDPQERRGKKKRPRTEEVVEVPQDVLSTTITGTKEEEVPRDNSIKSEEIPQEQGQGKNKRSRPPALLQEEEGSAIVVNVSTPPSKLNNNGLMNENAKYLIAKSQLYQAYLQALNNHQD